MPRLLRALVLAALLALPAAAPVPPRPALWVVRDADTIIFLFGSFHLLPPDLAWFEGPVREAFDGSQELVLEVPIPDPDPGGTAAAAQRLAFDPRPLASRIGPVLAARVDQAATRLGLPPSGFRTARPWFIATSLTLAEFERAGLSRGAGVEQTLSAAALAAGKPVTGIETVAGQLALLAGMGDKREAEFLDAALADLADAPDDLPKLVALWANGDVDDLARLLFAEDERFPDLKRTLVDDRNRAFAAWITDRLARPGRVMVVVGGGHFGGPAGLPALLAKQRVNTVRLQ